MTNIVREFCLRGLVTSQVVVRWSVFMWGVISVRAQSQVITPGVTPLWPCYSVYKLSPSPIQLEFNYSDTPLPTSYMAWYHHSPGWNTVPVTQCAFVLEAPLNYTLLLQLHTVQFADSSGNCSASAVRIYNYNTSGALDLAIATCKTSVLGLPVSTDTNTALVTTFLGRGQFGLRVTIVGRETTLDMTGQDTPQGTTQSNTQGNTQGNTQSTTQSTTQGNTQDTTQSTIQGNTQDTTQRTIQGTTQSTTQRTTQSNTQDITQRTIQGTTQSTTQRTTQSNTQNTTQGVGVSTNLRTEPEQEEYEISSGAEDGNELSSGAEDGNELSSGTEDGNELSSGTEDGNEMSSGPSGAEDGSEMSSGPSGAEDGSEMSSGPSGAEDGSEMSSGPSGAEDGSEMSSGTEDGSEMSSGPSGA